MTTFFEKLKKGMEIEKLPEKEVTDEPASAPASAKAMAGKEEKKPIKRLKKEPKKKPQKEKIKVEKDFSKKDSGKKEKLEPILEPIKKNFSIANLDEPAHQSFALQNLGGPEGELTVDVFETNQDIVIQSAIAGVEPENLDITVENDIVTIKGNREKQLIEERQNYFRQECYWGKFSREIILPVETDNSRAKAIIKNGILTIKIPKIKKVKIKKLIVEE